MADTTDNISMGNFSIENTMEMGMGNQELLNDLFEPETASSNPEDVTAIIKEANPPAAPVAPEKPKGKTITPIDDNADDNEKNQASIANFLGDDNDDDDEEETKIVSTKTDSKSKTNEEDDDDDSPTDTQFTALANDLFKLGVFNEDDDDEPITTPEQFLQKFEAEKKKGASEIVQNFIGQFGEDYQNAFDAIFVKGADPKEYFSTYNNVVGFAEMDLSDENNQVKILTQAFRDQGFDVEDTETEIERLKNYGDLESVAAKHHKVLVKKEAQKLNQLEQQAERELQQKQAVRNQYISNVQGILEDKLRTKEFDGIPLNPKLVNELQDFLLVDKWKTPSGETLSDFDRTILDLKRPENHAMKVKVGLILKILEKDPTLSTIQKSGVSKKTDQLFGEVARQVTKSKTSTSTPTNKNSWFQ